MLQHLAILDLGLHCSSSVCNMGIDRKSNHSYTILGWAYLWIGNGMLLPKNCACHIYISIYSASIVYWQVLLFAVSTAFHTTCLCHKNRFFSLLLILYFYFMMPRHGPTKFSQLLFDNSLSVHLKTWPRAIYSFFMLIFILYFISECETCFIAATGLWYTSLSLHLTFRILSVSVTKKWNIKKKLNTKFYAGGLLWPPIWTGSASSIARLAL